MSEETVKDQQPSAPVAQPKRARRFSVSGGKFIVDYFAKDTGAVLRFGMVHKDLSVSVLDIFPYKSPLLYLRSHIGITIGVPFLFRFTRIRPSLEMLLASLKALVEMASQSNKELAS